MTSLDQVLTRELAKWRAEPYSRFKSMNEGSHSYSARDEETQYGIEVHTKKIDHTSEIIVMLEVSKPAILGAVGKAGYFAIGPNDVVRDATPDEAF